MTQFAKLFEQGKMGELQLKNRIILSPMVSGYATEDGLITEQLIDYYAARARGGCGLVTIESSYPRHGGYTQTTGHIGRVRLDDDRCIPGLKRLVEAIHAGGARASIEINPHRGRADEFDPASATEAIHPRTGIKARALNIEDLKKLEKVTGEGAGRVKEAGFDSILIHGGSGYLVSEFLSPRTNQRTDEYGGDAKKRARFALELVTAVKEKVGAKFPVFFRMTADERIEGGFGLEHAIILSKLLEEAGADAIDVVSGVAETYAWVIPYMSMPLGCNVHLSQAIKKEIKIPVSVCGRIDNPYLAEKILREGKADFIVLGRALIADPEFPSKAMAGRANDICKCIACCRCFESIYKPPVGPMICTVNPAVGKEKEFEQGLKPTAEKKKVLVIGGGPGGMEAAKVAAQRGHTVTLVEKGNRLGGTMLLAGIFNSELPQLLKFMKRQIQSLPIDIKLRKAMTPALLKETNPDVVVLAAGDILRSSAIPGGNSSMGNVFSLNEARALIGGQAKRGLLWRMAALFLKYFYSPGVIRWLLRFNFPFQKRVIIIGGGFGACEVAQVLAERGKKVTIVEASTQLAGELPDIFSALVTQRLKEAGVKIFTEVKEKSITDKGVEIVDNNKTKVALAADNVVIATHLEADKALFSFIKGKVSEVYEVGDYSKSRRIHEAVSEGAQAGLKI